MGSHEPAMTTNYSLQKRLGLGLTLGVTLLWLLAVAASGLVIRYELDEVFDSALEETAQRLLPLAVVEIMNRELMATPQRILSLEAHEEYLTYLVRDSAGLPLLQSHNDTLVLFVEQPLKRCVARQCIRLIASYVQ